MTSSNRGIDEVQAIFVCSCANEQRRGQVPAEVILVAVVRVEHVGALGSSRDNEGLGIGMSVAATRMDVVFIVKRSGE